MSGFRGAVYYLQDTAYANLRDAIANVAIFFGFVGVFATVVGAADGLRLIPMAVLVLAHGHDKVGECSAVGSVLMTGVDLTGRARLRWS